MRRLIILFIIVGFNTGILAQSPTALTLEECIRLAEENSFQLQSDDYEITLAENIASITESRVLPRISGVLAMDNRFLQPYYFNQAWASVHADWSLGDLIRKTGQSSLQDIDTRKFEKEQHLLNVVSRSTSLYMSILQVGKQFEILGERLMFLQHHYQVSEGMWKAGLRSQLDLFQTESEIVRLQEDAARLTIVRNNLSVELSHLLGWERADSLQVVALEMDSLVSAPVPGISIQKLSNHPVLSTIDSRLIAQNLRTDEIGAEQIPHIALGSGYVADGDPTGDGNFWQINAGVVIPIYSGKAFTYQRLGSRAMSESLYAQRSDAERELLIHLVKVHDQLVSTKNLMELQQLRLNVSDRTVEFAEANYEAGIATNLDYISAQQKLTDVALEIEQTRLEYSMSLIEFYITTNQIDQIVALGYYQNGN